MAGECYPASGRDADGAAKVGARSWASESAAEDLMQRGAAV